LYLIFLFNLSLIIKFQGTFKQAVNCIVKKRMPLRKQSPS
jgi:hypothetical protein